jgi:hypothetical protein
MALTFKVFADSGLVTEAAPVVNQASDGSTGAVDVQLWVGSANTGKKIQDASAPGVDDLVMTIVDSNALSGQAVGAVKLALTQGALTAATAGASLNLGVDTINGGSANAVTFWMRVSATLLTAGNYTDLSLQLVDVIETDI